MAPFDPMLGVDERPCATHFDAHQGFRGLLTHSHISGVVFAASLGDPEDHPETGECPKGFSSWESLGQRSQKGKHEHPGGLRYIYLFGGQNELPDSGAKRAHRFGCRSFSWGSNSHLRFWDCRNPFSLEIKGAAEGSNAIKGTIFSY